MSLDRISIIIYCTGLRFLGVRVSLGSVFLNFSNPGAEREKAIRLVHWGESAVKRVIRHAQGLLIG